MLTTIPITLRGDYSWTRSLNIREICLYLRYLTEHDFTVIAGVVAKALGIDLITRIEDENRPNVDKTKRPIHEFRYNNKGLAMELLIALLLARLDSAERVNCNCSVKNGLPNNFSPGGYADNIAFYPSTVDSRVYQVIAEVSIKRDETVSHYRDQLKQAFEHAIEIATMYSSMRVYGLVINSGQIATSTLLHNVYRQFLTMNGLEENNDIRILPINTRDLVKIMMTLWKDNTYAFNSDILFRVFDELIGELRRDELPTESNWMVDFWLNTVNDAQIPRLDLDEPPEGESTERR